jgi:hypothetical protein
VFGAKDLTASISLDQCGGVILETGIQVADLKTKLSEAAEKEIKTCCK